ncbi:hypothetical protein CDD80_5796 [Ophiocordyceps camponoti-rufipedis]|uniref:endo-1,3(4)-beta-glucanase n=1 Tax=Ophiocordyceps camponoti-rufipedis TaxID=2004952 RepID=A0A2C5YST2_9HYPO|nr:hypothetical protein CDD80_5796 [Ophiocordyceps camponoti-rufipedis]
MRLSATVIGLAGAVIAFNGPRPAGQAYSLNVTYDQSNFFQSFNFFTGQDPTHGFVEFVDEATARQAGLLGNSSSNIIMGVDHQTVNPPNGRRSVRVESKQSFTRGLFVADIAHMPGSACGVWPAFWMFGPDWPKSGEIDIIEGVNTQSEALITLHTTSGCSVNNSGSQPTTTLKSPDCGAYGTNAGCGQEASASSNYGDGFNAVQGGVYATEWTSDHIAVWFFPRSAIPQDLSGGQPNPSSWEPPLARFAGCDFDSHFSNNQLVFDTTFCGDWAGSPSVWAADKTCSSLAATCNDYVGAHPEAFRDSYWEVKSVKVYQLGQQTAPMPPMPPMPPTAPMAPPPRPPVRQVVPSDEQPSIPSTSIDEQPSLPSTSSDEQLFPSSTSSDDQLYPSTQQSPWSEEDAEALPGQSTSSDEQPSPPRPDQQPTWPVVRQSLQTGVAEPPSQALPTGADWNPIYRRSFRPVRWRS